MALLDKPVLAAGYVPVGFRLIIKKELRMCMKVDEKANRSGVYFLWKDRELIYIGSSNNVRGRLRGHRNAFAFDLATYLPIQFPWYLSVEAAYIDGYMPSGNVRHKPTGISQEVIDEMLARRAGYE